MKYRKRPIVVEAFQMTGEALSARAAWPAWLTVVDGWRVGSTYSLEISKQHWPITRDDYIVLNDNGELSVIKPYTFEATYEVVGEGLSPALVPLENKPAQGPMTPERRQELLDLGYNFGTARFEDLPQANKPAQGPELADSGEPLSLRPVHWNGVRWVPDANAQEPELADSGDRVDYRGGGSS